MKTTFGWDITLSQRSAEQDAMQCLRDAMEETGLPENAFTVCINPDDEGSPTWHWSVKLASEK